MIGNVTQNPPTRLDRLLALAQGYAEFAMRNLGHVPPALLADTPTFRATASQQTAFCTRELAPRLPSVASLAGTLRRAMRWA